MAKSTTERFEKNIYIERRNGAYRFVVAVHPLPKDSATFSNIEDGVAWARRRRVELFEEKSGKRGRTNVALNSLSVGTFISNSNHSFSPGDIPLSDVFEVYEKNRLDKLASKASETSRLKRLKKWFGALALDELDYRCMEEWKNNRLEGRLGSGRATNREAGEKGSKVLTKHQRHYRKKCGVKLPEEKIHPVSTQTVRHEIVLLRRVVKYYFQLKGLKKQYGKWLSMHDLMDVELPEKADPRPRRLSDKELTDIIGNLKTVTLKSAVLFALLTTLRCSELVSLQWEHIDFERGVIKLMRPAHLKKTKTRTRDVPLIPRAIEILKNLGTKEKGPIFEISATGLSQAWRRAADAAGIYDARLHDCRREAISRLSERCNLKLADIVLFSGHTDIRTLTNHYLKPDPGLIARQVGDIPNSKYLAPFI